MAKMTGSEIFFLLWQLAEVLFNKQPEYEKQLKTTLPVKNIPFIPQDYHDKLVDLRPEPVDLDPIVLAEDNSPPPIPTLIDSIPIVTSPVISATTPTLRTVI